MFSSFVMLAIAAPFGPKEVYVNPSAFASTSEAVAAPLRAISSAVMVVVAAGTSTSRFVVRVAVTTVSPSVWSSVAAAGSSA